MAVHLMLIEYFQPYCRRAVHHFKVMELERGEVSSSPLTSTLLLVLANAPHNDQPSALPDVTDNVIFR
jgi:hypothetical protein